MSPFARSAYFRLLDSRQRQRAAERFSPDYPLVLFVSLSRLSQGAAIFAGLFQISGRFGELAPVNTAIALGLALAATGLSLFHIHDRPRFWAMIRNLRSPVSWEIILSGAYTAIVALNLGLLWSIPALGRVLMGYALVISALAALTAAGFAYRFLAHPAWNTPLLSVIYLISGLILGLALTSSYSYAPAFGGLGLNSKPVLGSLGLLLLLQAGVELLYLRYLNRLDRGLKAFILGREGRIFWPYISAYFILPLALVLASLLGRPSAVLSALAFAGLLLGAFLERLLFFLLERPVYLFCPRGEGRGLP